jgi:hypothetical protein
MGREAGLVGGGKVYIKAADAGDKDAAASLSFLGRNWPFMYKDTSDQAIYELVERAAKKGMLSLR